MSKFWQGNLKTLSKKLDVNYSGQYDFFLDNKIKIEVKASRAVDFNSHEILYVKALASDSTAKFDMNFQQVKPACCDVLIWVGVWRDVVRYWVLSSDEVAQNKYYSTGQHCVNTGEGQIHLKKSNITEFAAFESSAKELVDDVRKAYLRQISLS